MSERALVKNAADEDQVKEAKATEKIRQNQAQNDLIHVLSTKPGRRFVWRLLEPVNRLSFSEDPYVTAFQEGKRNCANTLLAAVVAARPEAYLEMMKESKETL